MGGSVFDGGRIGGEETTAVCAELAGIEEPAELKAVTATRSVLPASPGAIV
jgi:hypothetical protein